MWLHCNLKFVMSKAESVTVSVSSEPTTLPPQIHK